MGRYGGWAARGRYRARDVTEDGLLEGAIGHGGTIEDEALGGTIGHRGAIKDGPLGGAIGHGAL